ncbi:MAG TPA: hypothetical protein PL105_05930 [Caldilineaceae bacterium]|nr:hypothetical protein [Caldilineaceae bacterium]
MLMACGMTDSKVINVETNHEHIWRNTLLVLAILAIAGSMLWLFFVEMSFEPLLGVLAGVGGIVTYKKKVSKFVDSMVAVILVVLFLVCVILILSSNSTGPRFVSSATWETIILAINVVAGFSILALVIQVVLWALDSVNQSRVAKLIAWAMSGTAEEFVLRSLADKSLKVIASMIVWSVILASVWISVVLLITLIALAIGDQVSGTLDSLAQYGLIGAIMGACFGLGLSVYRINHQG